MIVFAVKMISLWVDGLIRYFGVERGSKGLHAFAQARLTDGLGRIFGMITDHLS